MPNPNTPSAGQGRVEAVKRWPFVESPGDFTIRLRRAHNETGDLLAAVRNVLIENPPTLTTPPATPVQPTASVEAVDRMDVTIALREWFGGERYARDYEYLDMQMGPQMKAMLEAVFASRRERLASLTPAPTQGDGATPTKHGPYRVKWLGAGVWAGVNDELSGELEGKEVWIIPVNGGDNG